MRRHTAAAEVGRHPLRQLRPLQHAAALGAARTLLACGGSTGNPRDSGPAQTTLRV